MSIKEKVRLILNKWIRANSGKGFTKIPFAREIYNSLTAYFKPDFIEINGYKMYLDKIDIGKISVFDEYEPFETEVIKNKIKERMNVLNIGAHIGYYTLLVSKIIGDNGRVFAFEPDIRNLEILKKNIILNKLKNIIIVSKAVSDKEGKQKFYLSSFGSNLHSLIYNAFNKPDKEIEIDVIKLDNYFKNYKGRIDFIIMDIEGAEGKVIKGMSNLLKKNKDIIIVTELIPHLLENSGTSFKYVINYLIKRGFKAYALNEKNKKIEPLTDIDNFLENRVDKVCDSFIFSRKDIKCK